MKFFKLATVAAFGLAAVFTGCSTDSGDDQSPTAVPSSDVHSFNVGSCNTNIDAASASILEGNKDDLVDYFQSLTDGKLRDAQKTGSSVKSKYAKVLASNPSNCEAQLGYALSSIANIINDQSLNAFVDTLESLKIIDRENNANLYKISTEEVAQVVVGTRTMASNTSQKSLILAIQDAIGSRLLTVTDSAITYLSNVVNNGNVTVTYTNDDRIIELDNGEFAPALGALYLIRAMLVGIASINMDFSMNGDFRWFEILDDVRPNNVSTSAEAKQLLTLLDRNGPFGTIKSEWEANYKSIPNLLDSAISYVQAGLQYGISEAANGLATQANDIYVVGNNEDADVSVSDLQKAIDSLDRFKKSLHGDVEFKIADQVVTVNIGKFFNITNFKSYLPYYKTVPQTEWYKPIATDYWSTELDDHTYAGEQLEGEFRNQMIITNNMEDVSSYFEGIDYGDDESYVHYNIEYKDKSDAYGHAGIVLAGCTGTFQINSFYYYNSKSDATYNPETNSYTYTDSNGNIITPDTLKISGAQFTLSSEYCKIENGETKFLTSERYITPNFFEFTDKNGNKTLSYREFLTGVKYEDEYGGLYRGYKASELKSLVIFPDVTFGGVLPNMTTDKFWDLLASDLFD